MSGRRGGGGGGRKKKDSGLSSLVALVNPQAVPAVPIEEENWVACERCEKWRKLPMGHYVDPHRPWYCEMNPDPQFNDCNVSEETYDKATETQYIYLEKGSVDTGKGVYTGIVLKGGQKKDDVTAAQAPAAAAASLEGSFLPGHLKLSQTRLLKFQRAFLKVAQFQGHWAYQGPEVFRFPPYVWEGLFTLAPTAAAAALNAVNKATATTYIKASEDKYSHASTAVLEAVIAALAQIDEINRKKEQIQVAKKIFQAQEAAKLALLQPPPPQMQLDPVTGQMVPVPQPDMGAAPPLIPDFGGGLLAPTFPLANPTENPDPGADLLAQAPHPPGPMQAAPSVPALVPPVSSTMPPPQ